MQVLQWMRTKSMRAMCFALFLCLIPASSWAGVFISVGFAPPVLPVYVQPPCPQPGWMWTPGYWAYGPDGYYWVPGTWVPAPQAGFLWTPPYWGWSGGLYVFHGGYWGPHVGYYGGVNYGGGYMGVGFAGGMWVGGGFRYNTAVMNVGPGIHNTYRDTTIVHNTTIINNNHVSYNGGPGGITHQPTQQENAYAHEQHMAPTSMQTQHEGAARANTSNYASHNGGHPQNAAMERPAAGNAHGANNNGVQRNNSGSESRPVGRPQPEQERQPQAQQAHQQQPQHESHQPSAQQHQSHQPPPQQHQSHQPPPPQHQSHQAPPPRNQEHGHR
jgi:hypothetical protein